MINSGGEKKLLRYNKIYAVDLRYIEVKLIDIKRVIFLNFEKTMLYQNKNICLIELHYIEVLLYFIGSYTCKHLTTLVTLFRRERGKSKETCEKISRMHMPGYFYYIRERESRIDWTNHFVSGSHLSQCPPLWHEQFSHIKGYITLCSYAQWYNNWVSAAVRCWYCAWTT